MNLLAILKELIDTNPRPGGQDFSARQLAILGTVIERAGSWGVKELAADLGIVKPAVTRAIDVLVEEGLATRAQVPFDRRTIRVTATAAGKKLWTGALKAGLRPAPQDARAA